MDTSLSDVTLEILIKLEFFEISGPVSFEEAFLSFLTAATGFFMFP